MTGKEFRNQKKSHSRILFFLLSLDRYVWTHHQHEDLTKSKRRRVEATAMAWEYTIFVKMFLKTMKKHILIGISNEEGRRVISILKTSRGLGFGYRSDMTAEILKQVIIEEWSVSLGVNRLYRLLDYWPFENSILVKLYLIVANLVNLPVGNSERSHVLIIPLLKRLSIRILGDVDSVFYLHKIKPIVAMEESCLLLLRRLPGSPKLKLQWNSGFGSKVNSSLSYWFGPLLGYSLFATILLFLSSWYYICDDLPVLSLSLTLSIILWETTSRSPPFDLDYITYTVRTVGISCS